MDIDFVGKFVDGQRTIPRGLETQGISMRANIPMTKKKSSEMATEHMIRAKNPATSKNSLKSEIDLFDKCPY